MFLVTGATGNVGGALVSALAEGGQPVRALTRAGSSKPLPAGVERATGDLNQPASLPLSSAAGRAARQPSGARR